MTKKAPVRDLIEIAPVRIEMVMAFAVALSVNSKVLRLIEKVELNSAQVDIDSVRREVRRVISGATILERQLSSTLADLVTPETKKGE